MKKTIIILSILLTMTFIPHLLKAESTAPVNGNFPKLSLNGRLNINDKLAVKTSDIAYQPANTNVNVAAAAANSNQAATAPAKNTNSTAIVLVIIAAIVIVGVIVGMIAIKKKKY